MAAQKPPAVEVWVRYPDDAEPWKTATTGGYSPRVEKIVAGCEADGAEVEIRVLGNRYEPRAFLAYLRGDADSVKPLP